MLEVPARLASALADRYRLERELGAGGMATVYLAEDLRHRRKVAIKVVHPELSAVIGSDRFLKEIELTANLQHPHILPLFDSGSADNQLFYVMPFVEGESLRDRLAREKQLPIDDAVRIAREVASALDYAHRRGVVHRDIKPENILLHDGQALVADFGIALAMQQAGGGRMTQTGMSLGTPNYMSPEQAMGEREIGPRSDVYALGAVAYEMLTGEAPFTGPTAQAVVAKVMTEEPASIILRRKTVPPAVEDAVLTALQKLPADRWGSAAEFARALDGQGGQTVRRTDGLARARTVAPARVPPYRRTAMVLGAVSALSAAAAAYAWLRTPAAAPQPLARYEVRLPYFVSQRNAYSGGSIAIAPDGGTIAYIGRREQGALSLWVRDRDALEARPLAGTEGADAPFFSPDGAWIGYFASGKMYKIATRGGAPVQLSDSANINLPTGSWRGDGTILFIGSAFEVRSVPESGGTSKTILPLESVGWGFPAALPGANTMLLTSCTNNCASMTLMAVDLASGKRYELVQGGARGWYVRSGYLVYARQDGGVFAQRFDARTLRLSGSPVPVVPNVYLSLGITPEMAFSENGTLVYFETGAAPELRITRADRAGNRSPVDPSWRGSFSYFALSPDGKQLAVSVNDGGRTEIWIKQLDHGPLTRLTFEGNINYRPAWHPDGRSVGFISDRDGSRSLPYIGRADGSAPPVRVQVPDTSQIDEIEWTRDGKWLAYRTGVVAGLRRIARTSLAPDSAGVAIDPGRFDQFMPTVSPDGRWLAYVTIESGREEVYVRPFPNTSDARWQVSTAGGTSPAWAHSGRELFFVDGANQMVAAAITGTPSFQAGVPRPLFSLERIAMPPYHQSFAVSPDDRSFLLLEDPSSADARGRYAIVTLNWFAGLQAPGQPGRAAP